MLREVSPCGWNDWAVWVSLDVFARVSASSGLRDGSELGLIWTSSTMLRVEDYLSGSSAQVGRVGVAPSVIMVRRDFWAERLFTVVDFINPFKLCAKLLCSAPNFYALRQNFTPKKASQKLGAERKMALRPTFSLYEIDPWPAFSLLVSVKGCITWQLKFISFDYKSNLCLCRNPI